MENVSNVSSEDELLQLRNEGKINESEYEELLSTMRKSVSNEAEIPPPQMEKSTSKRKLGKTAFVLMLVGIILPAICFIAVERLAQTSDGNMHAAIGPWFLLGVVFEIAAFVIGLIAWSDVFGKATVITISFILALLFLFAK